MFLSESNSFPRATRPGLKSFFRTMSSCSARGSGCSISVWDGDGVDRLWLSPSLTIESCLAVWQGVLTWDLVWTPWSSRPKSLLDFGNGAKVLDELHWNVGLSRRRIGDCLLGWCRSIGDLLLGSLYSDGVLNLDWSKLSLTVPSASSWTKSKSGF